jgi:hypothetical protein
MAKKKPRLIWGSSSEYYLDFDKPFNQLNITNFNRTSSNTADSGVREVCQFFDRDHLTGYMSHLTPQELDKLRHFYEYVKDGSSFSLYLDRDLIAHYSFDGETLRDQDFNTATYSKTGTKYFINPDTGLVESAGNNVHNQPDGQFGRAIQLETQVTNLLSDTQDFSSGNWSAVLATVSANLSTVNGPDGNNTADKITTTANAGGVKQETATNISTNDATFSCWLMGHKNDGVDVYLSIIRHDTGAALASESVSLQPGWNRYSITYESAGSIASTFDVSITGAATGTAFLAWGAQLELNAFMSSYRASGTCEDSLYIDLSDWTGLAKKGTVACWVKLPFDQEDAAGPKKIWYIQDSQPHTKYEFYIDSSEYLVLRLEQADDNSTNLEDVSSGANTNMDADTWYHVVCTWDFIDTKKLYIYLDGTEVNNDDIDDNGIGALPDKLYLGHDTAATAFSVMIDDLIVRQDALTANEIDWLYRSGRSGFVERNYYSALELIEKSYNPVRRIANNNYNFELNAWEVLT